MEQCILAILLDQGIFVIRDLVIGHRGLSFGRGINHSFVETSIPFTGPSANFVLGEDYCELKEVDFGVFSETSLGFACDVAYARARLDSFKPLTFRMLSKLSDVDEKMVERVCKIRGFKALSANDSDVHISAHDAFRYLQDNNIEPFASHYTEFLFKRFDSSNLEVDILRTFDE